jgi:hypothetical protein
MKDSEAPLPAIKQPHTQRSRLSSALAVVLLIVLGLSSRKFAYLLPSLLQKNMGDILWATLVFFLFGLLFPRLSTWRIAGLACLFSLCIEVSKFYHSGWFDAVRSTVLGRLVFGWVFSWSNLLCYLIGVLIGVLWECRKNSSEIPRTLFSFFHTK